MFLPPVHTLFLLPSILRHFKIPGVPIQQFLFLSAVFINIFWELFMPKAGSIIVFILQSHIFFPGWEQLKRRYICRCFQETVPSFLPLFTSGIRDFLMLRKVMNRRPRERRNTDCFFKMNWNQKWPPQNQWDCILTVPWVWVIGWVLARNKCSGIHFFKFPRWSNNIADVVMVWWGVLFGF